MPYQKVNQMQCLCRKSLSTEYLAVEDGQERADPLFAKLATLKVDDLFAQSVRIFSYKMSRGLLPGGMASFLEKLNHGHATRGARSNFFVSRSDPRSIKSIAPK